MLNDGPKRFGRFIKRNSRVIEKLALSEFSFKEIGEDRSIFHDNADRSIIHVKYHEKEDLDHSLKSPQKFNDNLVPPEQRRPILHPRDFTKEWERDKKLRKARAARLIEDEDFDYELDNIEQKIRDEAEAEFLSPQQKMEQTHLEETENVGGQNAAETAEPLSVNEMSGLNYQAIDVMGKAIKNLGQQARHEDDQESFAPNDHEAHAEFTAQPTTEESFIPVMPNPHFDADPEQSASERYRQQVAPPALSEEERALLIEEAKAIGYEDGFKAGEEKGEIQARQKAAAVFSKVSELVEELGNLKHEVLKNVQENFYELAQAIAESLLKREFTINPEAFASVIRRAIDEAVEPGRFKIKVSPDIFEKVSAVADSTLKEALVKDPALEPGDFKIESDLSIVDVNVRKLITELMEQVDLNLFETEEQAG